MSIRFEWEDRYTVGHEELDRQHRRMFEVANEVLRLAELEQGSPRFQGALRSMIEETRHHLDDEERILAEQGYPELEDHRKAHDEIREELASIVKGEEILMGDEEVLYLLMFEWVLQHILKEDFKFKPWLSGQQTARS